MFKPSIQQLAFFEAVKASKSSIILNAKAGSGKTTTILQALSYLPVNNQYGKPFRVAFVAFNSVIAKEIAGRQEVKDRPFTFVKTANGFGNSAITSWDKSLKLCVEGDRFKKRDAIRKLFEIPSYLQPFTEKLIEQSKNAAFGVLVKISDLEPWYDLIAKHDMDQMLNEFEDKIESFDEVLNTVVVKTIRYTVDDQMSAAIELAQRVLTAEIKSNLTKDIGYYDYVDQLWLPCALNLFMYSYPVVFADEVQDTAPIQECLYRKMVDPRGGKFYGVGDPFQAIYAWRGASSDSMERLKKAFGAIELPLSVSYRCPQNGVKMAQSFGVADIQAADTAIMGEISSMTYEAFIASLSDLALSKEDVILCRNKAPMVSFTFALWAKGVPARIEGRKEIGERLISLAEKWKSVKTLTDLADKLHEFKTTQTQKLIAKGEELKAEEISDTVDALISVIYACKPGSTLDDLKVKINSLFADGDKKVTLMTIHKSKGGEWDRVFWYGRSAYQPSPFARQDWQIEQERNLLYVGCTRFKKELIEIDAPIKGKKSEQ